MSYQPQPPPGYNYPLPNYYYPQPKTGRSKNETMKALAIIFFVFGFVLGILSYIPLIGFFIGLFGLLFNVIGFVCLCLI